MEDLSLHILDIAENSIDAGADRIEIMISIMSDNDKVILQVKDNGRGIDAETIKKVSDPFFTTKSVRKFGMGIPLLIQTAEECKGRHSIDSEPGRGTTITAEFQKSHIDRKPLGDMGATMAVLISGHPDKDFSLLFKKNGFSYRLDTVELRRELNGAPLNLPAVLKLIKEDVNEYVREEI
ncbi:MAG: ATP-binding protein [Thermodesulfovibrionales bacterium]|nr:ATP-binding protein [Thermodesulfovibrionales bacterium]